MQLNEIPEIKCEIASGIGKFYPEGNITRINEICDDILTNYFAFLLLQDTKKSAPDDFFIFLKQSGNLDDEVFRLVMEHPSIPGPLMKQDFSSLLQDSFSLARSYESVKSCVIEINQSGMKASASFRYRKSKGMFFTPKEIVDYIIDNSFQDISQRIMTCFDNNKLDEGISLLLEVKIADIACGTGSFLTEIFHKLNSIRQELIDKYGGKIRNDCIKADIILDERTFFSSVLKNSIFGVDIDRNAAFLCSHNLLRTAKLQNEDIQLYGTRVKVGDSLRGSVFHEQQHLGKTSCTTDQDIVWSREFPSVFSGNNPGFDLIVMNPPYGKVRLESNKGHNLSREVNDHDRNEMKNLSRFFRDSGQYPLSSNGLLNYYKLMVERATRLIKNGGTVGFIVPNTLLCDWSTSKLRRALFDKMDTRVIIEIPEKSTFFDDVTQAFCIVISTKAGRTSGIKFGGNIRKPADLINNHFIKVDLEFIRNKFPDMLYVPITSGLGFKIFNKLHLKEKISDIKMIKNSRGEVDLTKFSKIISDNHDNKRLIRGNNIERYRINENTDSKESFIDEDKLREQLGETSKIQDIEHERIISKQVANQNSSKRLEFVRVPPGTILGNSCNFLVIKDNHDPVIPGYLLGLLNSSLLEWRFRITSTNNHVNNYEIADLPIVFPDKNGLKWNYVKEIAGCVKKLELDYDEDLEAEIDAKVFKIFDLDDEEIEFIITELRPGEDYLKKIKNFSGEISPQSGVSNHLTAPLSDLEMRMVRAIPPGGNWKNIPDDVQSDRVNRIKQTGGRTTYYGRLRWDHPAYTISTYFSRTGNGCFIHPDQDRLISLREGARLQSFTDDFIFYGSKTSMYYQIGNAVPPLLSRAIGEIIKPRRFIDLFCGGGGFSKGMEMAGGKCVFALDHDKHCIETFRQNHDVNDDQFIAADICAINLEDTFSMFSDIDLVIGGPPCQGFSTAGKCILDDPRNELVRYFIRSIDILQPKVFVMENVKGLAHFKNGQVLKEIHDLFEKIGYDVQYRVLKAAEFGVPQLRERVIIIGRNDCKAVKFPLPLFSKDGVNLPKYMTVRDAIDDLLPLKVGEGRLESTPYHSDPNSLYQQLMRGLISFDEFYTRVSGSQTTKLIRKSEIRSTLNQFIEI
jgi:Alw26I/Eco31I/Esp3I family type II restriction m6 adenine DNA methyltransferase